MRRKPTAVLELNPKVMVHSLDARHARRLSWPEGSRRPRYRLAGNFFQKSFVVIVRRIHPPRNRPDGHGLARGRDEEVPWVRLGSAATAGNPPA